MTDDEWEAICFLMEQGWRGEFDDERRKAYRVFLDRFEPLALTEALHRLAQSGKPFLPAVPEIVKAVNDAADADTPAWPEAWEAIKRALWLNDEEYALDWLHDKRHPIIAAFVRLEGYVALQRRPFSDPDYGLLEQERLHQRWDEFLERAQTRLREGRTLEAMGERHELGPARLDESLLLGSLEPEARPELPSGE